MSPEPFSALAEAGADRVLFLHDAPGGLRALLCLDDLTLGPAVGGIRVRAYPTWAEGLADVTRLARAMTLKTALNGLDAGGAKLVVLDHPGMNRALAFRRLAEFIDDLQGRFWTGGDLGVTSEDLEAMAARTPYVAPDEPESSRATGATVVNVMRACATVRGVSVGDLRVAVQGCGRIGAAVAELLAEEGAELFVADPVAERAEAVARRTGARVMAPEAILAADVDVVSPCALGGVIDTTLATTLKAWAVCGGANNQIAHPVAEQILVERGVLFAPDVIASSGAAIRGVCEAIMKCDPAPLIAATTNTALEVFEAALSTRERPSLVAEIRANIRIARARAAGGRAQSKKA